MRQDLERLRGVWDDCQATRDRNAIYGYLAAVYDLVAWWTAEGRDRSKWSRVMRYAAAYKCDSEPFDQFVRRKGGINACGGRFSRHPRDSLGALRHPHRSA
jgi:hypothetical protein